MIPIFEEIWVIKHMGVVLFHRGSGIPMNSELFGEILTIITNYIKKIGNEELHLSDINYKSYKFNLFLCSSIKVAITEINFYLASEILLN